MTLIKKDFVYPALFVKGLNLMQKFIASDLRADMVEVEAQTAELLSTPRHKIVRSLLDGSVLWMLIFSGLCQLVKG